MILIFGILAFALFSGVFRYNILYVIHPKSDTQGLLYYNTLHQLFVGIYVMELYLTGLFALVRDNKGNPACVGQTIFMGTSIGLTMVFQLFLSKSYSAPTRQMSLRVEPLGSKQILSELQSPEGMDTSADFSKYLSVPIPSVWIFAETSQMSLQDLYKVMGDMRSVNKVQIRELNSD